MSPQLQTAIIAGVVSLITAGLTGLLSWQQMQRERSRWLYDLKSSFSVELYRKRMDEYAKLSRILMGLSTTQQRQLTLAKAHALAEEINEWMYGGGGLMAGVDTRNAGWALRDRLLRWKAGRLPEDVLQVRKLLFWSMRRDLDIPTGRGLDTSEQSMLAQLQEEMNRTMSV